MFCNGFVQLRLREHRLIAFVVSVFSVAQQINVNVPIPALAVCKRNSHHLHDCFRIVRIDMEREGLSHLTHICAINRASSVQIIGGKTNLVVDHDVDGPTCMVAVQLRHLGHFVYYTLTGHRRITVNQNGQNPVRVSSCRINPRAGQSFHYWSNGLEVRGIGRQRNRNRLPTVRLLRP